MIAMTVTLQTFVWCNCASQLKPENLLGLCAEFATCNIHPNEVDGALDG